MLMLVLSAIWVIWTVCVTVYYCLTNFWTAIRYSAGLGLAYYISTPTIMVGFVPGATFEQIAATVIYFHFMGSIFCPYIFGLTVLPAAIMAQFRK